MNWVGLSSDDMMRRGLIRTLVLSGIAITTPLWVWAGDLPADTTCGEAAAAALQRRYESVRDFRADIVQITHSVALGSNTSKEMTSKGSVVIAKPGKMRWSYDEPEPSEIVTDGEVLWIYDPTFREAQKLPAGDANLTGVAVQFLLGDGKLQRDFDISALSCEAEAAQLQLVPRTEASYEKLHVRLDPASGDLLGTTVFFVLGNVTEVAFSNIEINRNPDPGVFRLDLPDDVRVIEYDAAGP
jgi:outer membrane lipoprotein carrier protein